jgi:hypothetical protein
LSTTNPTRSDPGLRSERPATSHLRHGTDRSVELVTVDGK